MDSILPESEGELKKEGNSLVLKDDTPKDGESIKLPISGTGKIEMKNSEGSIKIDMLDDGSTGKATIVNESTVVYPNTAPGVDTVVTVPSDVMAETYHLIRSPDSPKEYEYKITIPEGGSLSQVDDKTVSILDAEGSLAMVINAPKATDANQSEVPISLVIRDNKVFLVVEHNESFVYPVVADPYFCKSVVESVVWDDRGGDYPWSLSIRPNRCAALLNHTSLGIAAWKELLSKAPKKSELWSMPSTETPSSQYNSKDWSMYDQFYCHLAIAGFKSRWNLEPTRPNVGYKKTLKALCNPTK